MYRKITSFILGVLVILIGIVYLKYSIPQVVNGEKYTKYTSTSTPKVINLIIPGKYKIFIEKGTTYDGVYFPENEIEGAFQIKVIDSKTNEEIEIKTSILGEEYVIGSRHGVYLYDFEINKPTKIEIIVESDNNYLLNIRSYSLIEETIMFWSIPVISFLSGIVIIIIPFIYKPKKPKRDKYSKWEPSY